MKILHQRLALLTGVSVSALGLATPALAATIPGVDHSLVAPSVDDTLTICAIGDNCDAGVTSRGAGLVKATVNSVASGEFRQVATATAVGGDVVLGMTNNGDAAISAIATASEAAGIASAFATIAPAIVQSGLGSGDVTLDLTNNGTLSINAAASASGTHALAAATANSAIHQFADSTGTGDASAAITNNGDLSIAVTGAAHGDTGAIAIANVYRGIGNYAAALGSGDAIASVNNAGDINLTAAASAGVEGTAGSASAIAFNSNAIQQTVYAQSGLASGNFDNSGTISIDAHAVASGVTTAPIAGSTAVNATAHAYNSFAIDQTGSAASGDVALEFSNSGTIDIGASATAVAAIGGSGTAAGIAFASAYMHDPIYQKAYAPGGDINIDASNDGEVDISNVAAATGAIAIAQAQIEYAISQYASAAGGDAHVSFTNYGVINETVGAVAHGTSGFGFGLAMVTSALFQLASAAGDASVNFANSGTFDVLATAAANGVSGAGAGAFVMEAIEQFAIASGAAAANMTNDGMIDLHAAAVANAETGNGSAIAFVSHGVSQHAYGGSSAEVTLTNSGKLTIAATGSDVSGSHAFGEAAVFQGIFQSASASGAATASFINSGTLEISAKAYGNGQVGRAIAVVAPAVVQAAYGTATRVTLDNSGTIDISAVAQGTGTIGAPVLADAFAIAQEAGSGTAEFINSGDVNVLASGHAIETGQSAFVGVSAAGLFQHGAIDRFDNSGTFTVKAVADASGSGGFVGGSATGYVGVGSGETLDVSNSGTFTVMASAKAPDQAMIRAAAMSFTAYGTWASGSSVPVQQALIDGAITNSGQLDVAAHAAAGGSIVFGTGSWAMTLPGSYATATAIRMDSGVNTATVTNSGAIHVEAVTDNGGPAVANGIVVVGNPTGLPPTADDVFTFNNDGGTIVVRQSTDGGETWQRGMAVDLSAAPNASVINLTGNGAIYGNIAIQAGDEINVADGTTYFDGIINPGSLPFDGLHSNDLDSGLAGVGMLNIQDGGNLVLADPRSTGNASMYDGPAYALVDTLNVDAGGTLTYELQPAAGGAQPVGSYPQLFANTANLDGTLLAEVTTAKGLFADSYSWDNVIDANVRNGTFDQCALGGAYAGSVLLNFACSYDANANVDLALTRIAFNDVAGLNGNAAAVGTGLECIYDTGLTGGVADMFADLFLFADQAKYDIALNQLSGSVYANYLNSFASLGAHYDDLVDHASDCVVPAVRGSVLECRSEGPVHLWGQLDYQWRRADGDAEAGKSTAKRFTGLLGIDANVGNAAILGIEGGYVTNHVRDSQFGDTVEGKGAQVGLYAAYDPGAFFVKGITTYSWFNGDSTRHVDFTGLASGATFRGTPTANPDANLWTIGLHGGARFDVGASSTATPYLNLDYARTRLQGFTETGLNGADLTVESSESSHSFLTGGVKWASGIGGVVPEINLGYRYRFGSGRADFNAFFNADSNCDFTIESAAQKKGTFLAGVSIGGRVGPVDVRIGYEGEFSGEVTSHSGNFKFVLPLGGHAAPPPPATVAAPAPPPVEAVPPPASPAPPAATERGERGQ